MQQIAQASSSVSRPSETQSTSERRMSYLLLKLSKIIRNDGLTFDELFELLESRSHCGVVLLLSIPFLVPVTIPGFSTPFGLLIIVAAATMAMGLKPWVPARLASRRLHGPMLANALRISAGVMKRLERVVRPRGRWLVGNPFVYRLNGIFLVIAGFLLALPTPPGGNFPPGVALVLLSLGTLEEDAVVTSIGYIVFALNILLFGALFYFGGTWAAEIFGHFVAG